MLLQKAGQCGEVPEEPRGRIKASKLGSSQNQYPSASGVPTDLNWNEVLEKDRSFRAEIASKT